MRRAGVSQKQDIAGKQSEAERNCLALYNVKANKISSYGVLNDQVVKCHVTQDSHSRTLEWKQMKEMFALSNFLLNDTLSLIGGDIPIVSFSG